MAKITRIEILHLKAIEKFDADLKGCTAIVIGKNDAGKSTLLRTLPDRIRGERPELIVKQGKENGKASLILTTGERFDWDFDTKGKDRLTFTTKDGYKTAVTKEIAKKFFPEMFDIDAFLQAQPKEQARMLQQLVGIDFTQIDLAYKNAYEERTLANRKVKEAEVASAGYVYDPNVGKELRDASTIEQELGSVSSHNERYEDHVEGRKEMDVDIENLAKRKKIVEDTAKSTIARLEKEIAETKKRSASEAKEIESSIEAEKQRIKEADAWLKEASNKPKDAVALTAKLDAIKKENEKIRYNIESESRIERLSESQQAAKEADELVKKIEAKKAKMIKDAKLPDGISISDDGILVDGLPLDKKQLSTSKVYITALRLAALKAGEVKTLYFDASPLDKKNLTEIQKWAKENDFQLLIERPSYEGGELQYELVECTEDK